ncbi:MAG TPA: cytochrome C [Hyphomicrobiales bacterium]|nr:cytochrome C [Hyphomicrobiales bacterium]
MSTHCLKVLALGAAIAAAMPAGAADAQSSCGGCHALSEPDFATLGVVERLQRQAPPLWFAGNKYKEGWLEQWLQAPTTILPAGYFPNAAITHTDEGDVVDPAKLHQHDALSAADAKAVADELMALKPHDDLIAAMNYEPGNLALRMGTMDFRKFKGCQACHHDAEGDGGFSGPELYTAWQRLQPAFIASFITDPRAWDTNTIMPQMEMNEAAVYKLVDYLRLIGGGEQ